MRSSLLATFLLVACAAPSSDEVSTESAVTRSECREAHIARLTIGDAEKPKDVCQGSAALKPQVARAIRDIKEIHEKAAALLEVDATALFGAGVRIHLSTGVAGFDGHFEPLDDDDLPRIHAETVEGAVTLVNRGVYAHELGHWLLWVPREPLATTLRSLGQAHFWGESIADTFALAIEGTATSPEPGVPACMERRSPADLENRSYRGPNGFFLDRFPRAQAFACCEQIASKPEFAKGAAVCDAQAELDQKDPFDPSIPFDDTPFPIAEATAAKLRGYSRYQLGVPLNSFLLDVRDAVEPTILTRFVRAAKNVTPIDFTCKLGAHADVPSVRVTVGSVKEQLAKARESLSPDKQQKFDELARAHGLDALDVLEPAELGLRAKGLATNVLLIPGAPGQGKQLPAEHACVLSLGFVQASSTGEEIDPDCIVTCERTRSERQ
jgi:hypothetical protein